MQEIKYADGQSVMTPALEAGQTAQVHFKTPDWIKHGGMGGWCGFSNDLNNCWVQLSINADPAKFTVGTAGSMSGKVSFVPWPDNMPGPPAIFGIASLKPSTDYYISVKVDGKAQNGVKVKLYANMVKD